MKIVGLITEYNPFHNGHLYHIQKAKEVTGADAVIAVMSGDFVQRGAPSIMPKHLRAACALLSGVSAVIELPVCYALSSAESFALGAVSLLDKLGVADSVCFGSECGEIRVLQEIADLLSEEPETYRTALRESLRNGLSFPSARQKALSQYGPVLSQPNNILGIEYLKALRTLNSSIRPYTIRREGSGYHDPALGKRFSSAQAIRENLEDLPALSDQIPSHCLALMNSCRGSRFPLQKNDFSLLLKAKLLTETPASLMNYADISEDLANRILGRRNDFVNLEQFCSLLKTKELTYSRISRALFHILLNISRKDMERYRDAGYTFYARLLGFRKQDSRLLTEMKRRSQIPLITRLSRADLTDLPGNRMLKGDIYAADLYESVVTERFQTPFINEKQQQIAVV